MIAEYTETLKVRIYDINYGEHLGHTELVNLLHETRMQFLKKYGLTEISSENQVLMMRQLHIDYLNQAYWDNELKFQIQLHQNLAKIRFSYVVHNLTLNNKTAEAEATMILFDLRQKKTAKPNLFFERFNPCTGS